MNRYLSAPLCGAEAFLPTESCTALLEYPLTQSSGKKQLLLEEDRLPAAGRASRLQRTLRRSHSRSGYRRKSRERRPRSSARFARQDPNELTPTVGGVSPARLPEPVPSTNLPAQVLPQLHVILGAGAGADPAHQ